MLSLNFIVLSGLQTETSEEDTQHLQHRGGGASRKHQISPGNSLVPGGLEKCLTKIAERGGQDCHGSMSELLWSGGLSENVVRSGSVPLDCPSRLSSF